ncbi:2-deoxy-scyllo-inosose synthase [Paenibacillus sp. UMB4589-SE434]|uniref:2-deoxy-scyllo-inosose synthase n=1 Tax=Paenibacillus sp. UMB4589-SE434 TaxID=3046314 RepID=UPI00254C8B0A|nr:2-deoxy-scyllo-inosose synthase [Paenibacillus sp. UMB4589-SE434]MDK8182168.1 2-deoxy-scyllo-inosose synthase [Paenibacillus sp. UMB4589-SE434]
MTHKVRTIQFGSYKYDFWYGKHVISQLSSWFTNQESIPGCFILIADTGIPPRILEETSAELERAGIVHVLRFQPGEEHKNLATVAQLCEQVIGLGADRRAVIVAVGGGVTGNIAGMVAGMLFRGLPLIHVPTTLMAASDSVLSLKQAVNLSSGKNLVGFYYAPRIVCAELSYISNLPVREIRAGLCEAVKNLLTIAPEEIDRFKEIFRPDHQYHSGELGDIIDFCIRAKSTVMREDPFEKKTGLILEYGHTIGHALELASKGQYNHGESVAFGMLCAARIAEKLGLLSREAVNLHHELLNQIGAWIQPRQELLPAVEHILHSDNKRGYRQSRPGHTGMVLLQGLGEPAMQHDSYITLVPNDLIHEVMQEQIQLKQSVVS